MATTTKKKREIKLKIAEESLETQAVIVEQSPTIPDQLSADHLRELEIIARDIENAKLFMAVGEQELKNMLLSLEILNNKIEKQKLIVSARAQSFEGIKTKFISFKKNIWPQYGLQESDPMGYDPISGLIKRS